MLEEVHQHTKPTGIVSICKFFLIFKESQTDSLEHTKTPTPTHHQCSIMVLFPVCSHRWSNEQEAKMLIFNFKVTIKLECSCFWNYLANMTVWMHIKSNNDNNNVAFFNLNGIKTRISRVKVPHFIIKFLMNKHHNHLAVLKNVLIYKLNFWRLENTQA